MKKKLAITLGLILLTVVLTSCFSNAGKSSSTASKFTSQKAENSYEGSSVISSNEPVLEKKYIALTGSKKYFISSDCENWTEKDTNYNINSTPFFVNNQYLIFTATGIQITSNDGIEWTIKDNSGPKKNTEAVSLNNITNDIVYNGKIFISLYYGATYNYSTDGITWLQHDVNGVQSSSEIKSLTWNGTKFIAVDGAGYIYTSMDGMDWSTSSSVYPRNNSPYPVGTGVKIASDGSNYVVPSITYPNYLIFASKGSDWYQSANQNSSPDFYSSSVTVTANSIIYTGTKYLLLLSNGNILSSVDGLKWELTSIGINEKITRLQLIGSYKTK